MTMQFDAHASHAHKSYNENPEQVKSDQPNYLDDYLRFEVLDKSSEGEPVVLGSALLQARELVSLR
jgi:hypothetical protein